MHRLESGLLYYISYLTENGEELIVATTRPETIEFDVAIAVNPDDDRFKVLFYSMFRSFWDEM